MSKETVPVGILAEQDWFNHRQLQVEGYVHRQLPRSTIVRVRRAQRHQQPDMPSPAFRYITVEHRWAVERIDAKEPAPTPSGNAARLSIEKVREIRAANQTQQALAERYGVSDSTISRIRMRHTWRWLDRHPDNSSVALTSLQGHRKTPAKLPVVSKGVAMQTIGPGYMKIGRLSELTGLSVQAIRFYEREKLLTPTRNNQG